MSETESEGKFAWQRKLFAAVAVGGSIVHLYFNLFGTVSTHYQNVFHFSVFVVLGSLIYPFHRKTERNRVFSVLETLVAVAAAATAGYLALAESAIYDRGARFDFWEAAGAVFVLLVLLEYVRRVSGNVIPVLIVFSLSYVTWLGPYLGGVFNFAGLSLGNVLFRSVYGDDGVFGNLAGISSTYVFLFILFGGFLQVSGAGDFIIALSKKLTGRFAGGQGFVAVVASALTGTISGSAVANTASTGVVTIPMMKKAGYRPEFAGGIEAASSTGGQLMPPIMGAGAFVMASYTGVPYSQIVLLSLAPALLYFASVFFVVYFESRKIGLVAETESRVEWGELMRRGGYSFTVPIALLISMLAAGFSPAYSAGFAILALVGISWFTEIKMTPSKILEAVVAGCRNMVMTAIILIAIGLVVNSIVTAGVGNTFSLMIAEWSGNNVLLALVLIALASLVLGMGLPVTASYIVLATLAAPALAGMIQFNQLVDFVATNGLPETASGILLLADPEIAGKLASPGLGASLVEEALGKIPVELLTPVRESVFSPEAGIGVLLVSHLIIFWLSQDSNITPPVCLVAFTAAAIAKSPPMKTGFESWKLAKGLYIVPVLLAYTSLGTGDFWEIAVAFGWGLIGIFAFSSAMQGFLVRKLKIPVRAAVFLIAFFVLQPGFLALQATGTVLLAALVFWEKRRSALSESPS